MNKAVKYGAALIAVYLLVQHYNGTKATIDSGTKGGSLVIKALQGR